ncbi:hypothetical protein OBV_22670 [Oscillibacter valericigenes Sjm18-20]|nr:hypothetical protein OBV_22670 [Oscillibacter valericigenes Sjm18-20]
MEGKRIKKAAAGPTRKGKKRVTASKAIAFWMLALTTMVSIATLYLMRLCVIRDFSGALYPLSALIVLCQAGNTVVLTAITNKSRAQNSKGGITYEAAARNNFGNDL